MQAVSEGALKILKRILLTLINVMVKLTCKSMIIACWPLSIKGEI